MTPLTLSDIKSKMDYLGYSLKKTNGKKLFFIAKTLGKDRVKELKKLEEKLTGSKWENKDSSVGRLTFTGDVGYVYLKPNPNDKGASESLGIQTAVLLSGQKISHGSTEPACCWGEHKFSGFVFTDHQTLLKAIRTGLSRTTLSKEVVAWFCDDILKGKKYNKFEWHHDMSPKEIDQFGKYLGEVLIGYFLLAGDKSILSGSGASEFNSPVAKFVLPNDPSFNGIDSLFVLKNGTKIPVSSKYGVGAAASFFANILPVMMEHWEKMEPSKAKDFCNAVSKMKLSSKEYGKIGTEILYNYGVEHLLKLKTKQSPLEIFQEARTCEPGKMTKLSATLLDICHEIRKKGSPPKEIIEHLPASITSYFCRAVADELSDQKSIDSMQKVIFGKSFWQANLDEKMWADGKVMFHIARAGTTSLKIIGSKAATTSNVAKQGLLNYILKSG